MAAGGDCFKICCRRCDDRGWLPVRSDSSERVICQCQQRPEKSLLIQFLNWLLNKT